MVISIAVAECARPVRLCKVVFDSGYHLVVGGRLVKSVRGKEIRAFPDLPEYGYGDFPASVDSYVDGDSGVAVSVLSDGHMKPVGPVRACQLLFTPVPAEAVRDWIRGAAA